MVTASAARIDPRTFGRKAAAAAAKAPTSLADDLRLFAMFFLGGFTFMGVYLA